ncbi:MAG: hypothetical protein VX899_13490 [Myxococcota bacterium]|nr:hypothetical protein [Myxococcota bacterium]
MHHARWLILLPLLAGGCELFDPEPQGLNDVVFEDDSPVAGTDLVAYTVGNPRVDPDQQVGYRWIWEQDGIEFKCQDDFDWTCPDLSRTCTKGASDAYDEALSDEEKSELANVISGANTSKGQAWRITVRPIDDTCDVGPGISRSISVKNTPPTATVSIQPDSPASHDDLLAIAEGSDADGDNVRFDYIWIKKGSSSVEFEGATLDASETRSGEVWLVQATPYDTEDGSPATAEVTIGNAKPEVDTIAIEQAAPTTTDDISVVATFSDEEDDPMSVTVVWNLVEGEGESELRTELKREILDADDIDIGDSGMSGDGQWRAWLEHDLYIKDQVIEVTLTANDGQDSDPRSVSVTTVNSPPTLTEGSVTIEPTDDTKDISKNNLPTCSWDESAYYDADNADFPPEDEVDIAVPSAFVVTWEISSGSNAGDYDDSVFSADTYQYGNNLRCSIQPSDGFDLGEAVFSGSERVGNAEPRITLGIEGYDTSTLTGTGLAPMSKEDAFAGAVIEDPDGNSISETSYYWAVNGSTVSGSTTLDNTNFERGDTIELTVIAKDTAGAQASETTSVVVQNSPPSLNNVLISPTTLYADSTVLGIPAASDADGDSYVATYTWTTSTASTVTTSSALPLGISRGQTVTLSVTLDDNYTVSSLTSVHGTRSTTLSHGPVTVQNSPPQLPEVTLSPISPIEGKHNAVCAFTSGSPTDADGDGVSVAWTLAHTQSGTVNTYTSTSSATPTLGAANLVAGDIITCTAVATDTLSATTTGTVTDTVLSDTMTYILLPADLDVIGTDQCASSGEVFLTSSDIELTWTDTYPDDGFHDPAGLTVDLNWLATCSSSDLERDVSFSSDTVTASFTGSYSIANVYTASCNDCSTGSPLTSSWDLSSAISYYSAGSDNTLTVSLVNDTLATTTLFTDDLGDEGLGLVTVTY